jgi:hypothetical protein
MAEQCQTRMSEAVYVWRCTWARGGVRLVGERSSLRSRPAVSVVQHVSAVRSALKLSQRTARFHRS